jgi:hypothetical protein
MSTAKYQHGSTEPGWMEQTDTPRTDAFVAENSLLAYSEDKYELTIVHARELERELNASKAEVERLREQLESTQNLCLKFWGVLEELGFKLEINQ